MKFDLQDDIGVFHMDDGKVNCVGHSMLDATNAALDAAEKDAKALIIRGRDGMFSAGFDLKEFQKGAEATAALCTRGFELLIRLYDFPLPVVAACSGHGIAMGAFILMASDTRIGCRGDFRFSLPETRIGMEIPPLLMALTLANIDKRYINRIAIQSEEVGPEEAITAGFLTETVAAGELDARAAACAKTLAGLPTAQYAANKRFARAATLSEMRQSLDTLKQNFANAS